ncbi:hypothetical protein FRC07_012208, partial [Ceratobasidium sp. 392]
FKPESEIINRNTVVTSLKTDGDYLTFPAFATQPLPLIIQRLTQKGCRDLTDELDDSSRSLYAVSTGGFGDVFRGRLRDRRQVAIKALRVPVGPDDESNKLPK